MNKQDVVKYLHACGMKHAGRELQRLTVKKATDPEFDRVGDLGEWLDRAFDWESSKQGAAYWQCIHDQLTGHNLASVSSKIISSTKKTSAKLKICPKASECDEKSCLHAKPHKKLPTCNYPDSFCHECVPALAEEQPKPVIAPPQDTCEEMQACPRANTDRCGNPACAHSHVHEHSSSCDVPCGKDIGVCIPIKAKSTQADEHMRICSERHTHACVVDCTHAAPHLFSGSCTIQCRYSKTAQCIPYKAVQDDPISEMRLDLIRTALRFLADNTPALEHLLRIASKK